MFLPCGATGDGTQWRGEALVPGLGQLLAANPVGAPRTAWWKRGVRIESLSSSSCTSVQSLFRYLPGTHPQEGLSDVFHWQEDRKRNTGRLGKICVDQTTKMYLCFYFLGIRWLDFMGLDLLRNLSDDSHALDCLMWTLDLDLTHFPPLFFSPPPFLFTPIVYLYSNFPPSSPFLLYTHPSPPSLSVTQGQRHEESAGFPTEEERVAGKQPSRQDRQIHEIRQVSGHFLAACVGVCLCVATFRVGARHSSRWPGLRSQTPGQRHRWKNVYHWPVWRRGSSNCLDYFKGILHKICELASLGASRWFIYCSSINV